MRRSTSTARATPAPRATSPRTGSRRNSSTRSSTSRPDSSRTLGYPGRAMLQFFAVIDVILSIELVGLILMHSGRAARFGGMGFTPASQGATHIVERNMTPLTVVIGILSFSTLIVLFPLL